jgi:hypothetical protein
MIKAPIDIKEYFDYSEEEVFEKIKKDILDLGFIRFNI